MSGESRISHETNDDASTQTLPPPVSSGLATDVATGISKTSSEMLVPTKTALEHFADRRAWLLVIRGLAIGFVVFVVGMVLLALADQFVRMGTGVRTAASLIVDALAIGAAWFYGIRESRTRDWTAIARRMESATPALRERMLSAVELGTTDTGSSSAKMNGSLEFRRELQTQVADQLSKLQVARMLPWGLVRRWTLVAASIAMSIGLLSLFPSWQVPRRLARVMIPIAPIERASMTKIEIVRPAPPTRSVAEGDLVAVAASIANLGRGSVYLEWRSDDGGEDSLVMSPRDLTPLSGIDQLLNASSDDETDSANDQQTESFAVNVQVHQKPIHYRIIAGDGETLWHTLTPQPRPKMVSFEKRYQFPAYAKLPELVANDEFGDLVGIVGTRAEVTVNFDQPVHRVELLFGDGRSDIRVPVSPVDDSSTQFRYQVPIKTPGSYRVDAVSLASKLNNPFSPRFSIDPLIDQPPTAVWLNGTPSRQIVSSAAVIDLAGVIEDDLPMDTWVQQVVLDDGSVIDRPMRLEIDSVPAQIDSSIQSDLEADFRTRANVSLKWDMMRFAGRGEPTPLPPGSQLKTRLIALDRAGNRGASEWIHVFIAGDEFDASRHDDLRRVQLLSRQIRSWFDDFGKLGEELNQFVKESKGKPASELQVEPAWQKTLDGLRERWLEIGGWNGPTSNTNEPSNPITLESRVSKTNDSVQADRWVLLDRYVSSTLDQLQDGISSWVGLDEQKSNLEPRDQDKRFRQGVEMINRSARPSAQITELSQWILSIELAAGLMRDLEVIRSDAELLSRDDSKVPVERLPGQADLLVERLREVGELAESMQMDLPNNTVRHQERLHRYLTESMARIEEENQKLQLDRNPNVVVNFQKVMARTAEELRYHLTTSLLQGDTFNQIIAAARDLNRDHLQNYRSIEILRDVARDHERSKVDSERAREKDDTEEMKFAATNEQLDQGRFDRGREWAQRQFEQAEVIERSRKDTSVQAASDWKLIGAVIETVTDEQFERPENQTTDRTNEQALDEIRKNASILESGNQLVRLTAQLQDLADRERYGENRADGAIRQGARLEHYQAVSETPLQVLQSSGIDGQLMEELKATRWDKDFQQARQWTISRRYESDPFVSASTPVQEMVNRIRQRLPVIDTKMGEARDALRAYLPTTGELARNAAEESRNAAEESRKEAEEANDSERKDQERPASDESIEALQDKVDSLAENLADRANTADYEDESERELARDADAALAKIKEQMDAVAKADAAVSAATKESPEAENASGDLASEDAKLLNETLDTLADTLEMTAEHFDAADQGEAVESTREALREGAPDSETQMAADSAEATNRAANATPEELLERLEDRLDADTTMQQELAEISQQTAAAAEQAVRSASKQETRLRQELERVDPEFAEKKRELRDQLRSLTDQARSVNDHWLSMTEGVSGWDKDQDARDAIRQSREELNQAVGRVDQVQNDQALLSEIEEAADQLRSAIKDVVDQADQVQGQASARVDEKVHRDEKTRQQKARQLEQAQLQAKNRWLKALSDQAKDWKRRRDDAGRRVQTAQNQERNAERQLQQAKKQLEKHPDEAWAQKGFQESEQRVEEAQRAGEQAKQTRESAEKAEKEASNRLSEERRNSVKDLKENNPTAELLARVAEKSSRELQRISESLEPISNQSELAESLSPPASDIERLADQQSQTSQTIEQAAGDLQRAARHEERLGNQRAADELKKAAEQLQATLSESMQQAQQSLEQASQASENSDPARQAGEQLSTAATQLADQADQISELRKAFASQENDSPMTARDEASDDRNGAAPADPSPMKEMSTGTLAEADRSEKLARTLDELDRGINQQPADQGQPADGSQQGQPSPDGETANGQYPNSQSSGTQPTAGDASPTLAASAEQAIRDLAAKRQQQVQQIASAGQPSDAAGNADGDPSSQSNSQGEGESGEPNQGQDGQPGTVSGDGSQMPGGGLLDIADQGRVDEQWGMLREQKNDNVIQDRKARLPMSYRPAIEAYFQAISAEAARAQSTRAQSTRIEDSE